MRKKETRDANPLDFLETQMAVAQKMNQNGTLGVLSHTQIDVHDTAEMQILPIPSGTIGVRDLKKGALSGIGFLLVTERHIGNGFLFRFSYPLKALQKLIA